MAVLTRREWLAGAAAQLAPSNRRPNILLCISDDQSYPHAGACGSPFFVTPGFDRVAREGVQFRYAFVSAPSCAPSRASLLTGQDFYRLREASMNHTVWPGGLSTYPDALAAAGYHIGFTGKGWGPGNWEVSGRPVTPCGPAYNRARLTPPAKYLSDIDYAANFEEFLERRPAGAPFCFWAGFSEPHREFEPGAGKKHGKRLAEAPVPRFLPDVDAVRSDIADYAFEVEYYDKHLAHMLEFLEKRGELDNTLIAVTSDNGMAFPRAKGNLYDFGVRVPLAIRWGSRLRGGRILDDFVRLTDLAPTFLEAAGVPSLPGTTGRSLMPLLTSGLLGQVDASRDFAVFGMERHFPGSRPDGVGYPCRGIRTPGWLYIRNYAPERNPAGDRPGPVWPAGDPVGGYGDVDGSPSKTCLWTNRQKYPELYQLAFGKRPAEELYDMRQDPYSLRNLAGENKLTALRKVLAKRLDQYLIATADPRATGKGELLDKIMKRYPAEGANQTSAR
mgnify:CR=1 FL=1